MEMELAGRGQDDCEACLNKMRIQLVIENSDYEQYNYAASVSRISASVV
jgi:hypothetical protein